MLCSMFVWWMDHDAVARFWQGWPMRASYEDVGLLETAALRYSASVGGMKPPAWKNPRRLLSYEERCQIQALLATGLSIRKVAAQLGRAPSTISVKTGKNPGKRCQAHHTMPVKFESKFKRAGLNIHDPKYARWWISQKGVKNNHQSLAHEYNKRWEAFFKRNPSASKSQILEYRKKIDNSYRKRNVFRC